MGVVAVAMRECIELGKGLGISEAGEFREEVRRADDLELPCLARSCCERECSQVPGAGSWVVPSMRGRGSLWSDWTRTEVGKQSAHCSAVAWWGDGGG